jgi:hypothetical protein
VSLDHRDDGAVSAFTEEVDQRLGRGESGLEPWTVGLLAAWVLSGVLITLAVRSDGAVSTVLYLVAFVTVAVWVTGFYSARGGSHWFRR